MFKEFISYIATSVEEKINSTMYGSFILSWCLWNWKSIYITFFVDQDKIKEIYGVLKSDYLSNLYQLSSWGSVLWTVAQIILLPAITAYLIVFQLYKIEKFFFTRALKNKYEKKRAINIEEKKFLEGEQKKLKTKSENVMIEKKIESQMSDKWEIEYNNVKQDKQFVERMSKLQQLLYDYSGYIISFKNNIHGGSSMVAYYDSNGLVNKIIGNNSYVEATDKGKYFIKRYLEGDIIK